MGASLRSRARTAQLVGHRRPPQGAVGVDRPRPATALAFPLAPSCGGVEQCVDGGGHSQRMTIVSRRLPPRNHRRRRRQRQHRRVIRLRHPHRLPLDPVGAFRGRVRSIGRHPLLRHSGRTWGGRRAARKEARRRENPRPSPVVREREPLTTASTRTFGGTWGPVTMTASTSLTGSTSASSGCPRGSLNLSLIHI